MIFIFSIIGGIVILVVILLWLKWCVSIPDYMAARHYRFGRPTTSEPISGTRILKIPFMDQIIMIDKRVQRSVITDRQVITKERQLVNIDIMVIWKPIDVTKTIGNIHPQEIEPNFEKIIESILRSEMATMTVNEILEDRKQIAIKLQKVLGDSAVNWGIGITSVEISDIKIINKTFLENMAKPMEIHIEKIAKLAEIEKENEIKIKEIQGEQKTELAKIETKELLGVKNQETMLSIEKINKNREIMIAEFEEKLKQIYANINLMEQQKIAEADKYSKAREIEILQEKLSVLNDQIKPRILAYNLVEVLPDIYKNLKIGDITIFGGGDGKNTGFDVYGNLLAPVLMLCKHLGIDFSSVSKEEFKSQEIIEEKIKEKKEVNKDVNK